MKRTKKHLRSALRSTVRVRAKEVWGSDAIAGCCAPIDIPYLALNPGASYRGLQRSIDHYLGNGRPHMLSACRGVRRGDRAGYARSATHDGRGSALDVGLMHSSMRFQRLVRPRAMLRARRDRALGRRPKRRPGID